MTSEDRSSLTKTILKYFFLIYLTMKSQRQQKNKQGKILNQKNIGKAAQVQQLKDKQKSQKMVKPAEKAQEKQIFNQKQEKKSKPLTKIDEKLDQIMKEGHTNDQQIQSPNEVVQLEIDLESMAPCNIQLTLVRVFQQFQLCDPRLNQLYQKNNSKACRFLISPLTVISTSKNPKAMFTLEGMKKYVDFELNLASNFIFDWLVQLFYNLHPNNLKAFSKVSYLKITKESIYLTESPLLQSVILRDEKYNWDNPFRVLALGLVKNQEQYFAQFASFGQQFNKISTFDDLIKIYFSYKYGKFKQDIFSLQNVARKIKEQTMIKPQQNDDTGLDGQDVKWIEKQINLSKKKKFYLHFRASECSYDPTQFWTQLTKMPQNSNPNQLLVLRIQNSSGKDKLVGFYSPILAQNPQPQAHKIFTYIPDQKKLSLLINISQRTIHHLNDPKYAIGYGKQLLLCIGKCDIILSAFNVTNLCYFPVSYDPDNQHLCTTAESLCGKRFKLKELYVYRVGDNVDVR